MSFTTRRPLEDRFLDKLILGDPDGHWLWGGATCISYGQIKAPGGKSRTLLAHRVSYELFVGPIPEGLVINHLCFTPACVNPHHLEAVTQLENVTHSNNILGLGFAKTACVNGHGLTEDNTLWYTRKGRPKRRCRICYGEQQRRAKRKYKAKIRALRDTSPQGGTS